MCLSEKTFRERLKQKVTKKEWIKRQREANSQKEGTATVDRHTLGTCNHYGVKRTSMLFLDHEAPVLTSFYP